jgi:hypothetical protein
MLDVRWFLGSIGVLAVASACVWPGAGRIADARGKQVLPAPGKKDLCARSFGGSITYDHGLYHWFCSGVHKIGARKTGSFSLQCGPKSFDSRKRYAYWVSSRAVRLTKVSWDPSFGELALAFHNQSGKPQKYEYWESCLGSF